MKRTITNGVRVLVAVAMAYYVFDALWDEFFGSLQYFTYTGSAIAAVVLVAIAFGRVHERHLVLALSIVTIIHVVYIVLLVGFDGVVDDFLTGGLDNLVLHYAPPYYLAFDLFALSSAAAYRFRDTLSYLLVPVTYLAFVLVYGRVTGEYPYFFLNVPELGIVVLYYAAAIAGFFVVLNLGLVAAMKRTSRARVRSR